MLTPKSAELVADPFRHDGQADQFFEDGFVTAFTQMRERQSNGLPMAVYYAFKQAESDGEDAELASTGWEKLLEGLISAEWSVTGTWPVRTDGPAVYEASVRMRWLPLWSLLVVLAHPTRGLPIGAG